MKKYIILGCFAIGSMFLFARPTFAAFWESYDVPIPSGAQIMQSQDSQMGEVTRKNVVYKTSLSPEEVLEFFSGQMPAKGWSTDTSFAEVMKKLKMPEEQTQTSLAAIQNNTLSFTKGDYSMFLVVMPGQPNSKFTVFTINYGKKIEMMGDQGQPAKKLDFMPVYPEAKQMFSTKDTYVYAAEANIDSVVSFYKKNMLDYGWQLAEETPVSETNLAESAALQQKLRETPGYQTGATGNLAGKAQPEMQKMAMDIAGKIKVQKAELRYTKPGEKPISLEFQYADTSDYGLPGRTSIKVSINAE